MSKHSEDTRIQAIEKAWAKILQTKSYTHGVCIVDSEYIRAMEAALAIPESSELTPTKADDPKCGRCGNTGTQWDNDGYSPCPKPIDLAAENAALKSKLEELGKILALVREDRDKWMAKVLRGHPRRGTSEP